MSFEQVEEAWDLIDKSRDFAKSRTESPGPDDYWADFFQAIDLVDQERTRREGGTPPTRIFLRSPYGLQWRSEYKDWIPFRHGEVVLPPLDLD